MGKYKIVDLVFDEREHEIWVIVINKDEDTGERFLCLLDGSDIMQTTEIYELKPEPNKKSDNTPEDMFDKWQKIFCTNLKNYKRKVSIEDML